MANRVLKSTSRFSRSSIRRGVLSESIIRSGSVMPIPCAPCARLHRSCIASEADSSRCAECIATGRSDCDIFGLSRSQLLKIADRHSSIESELEAAEEEAEKLAAKVSRLRREKKL
jgi:hypothetical protein